MFPDALTHLSGRIQHAGRRLAVNHCDVGDVGMLFEQGLNCICIDGLRFVKRCLDSGNLQPLGNRQHAFSIRAVVDDQKSSARRYDRPDRCLDGESTAALHQHTGKFVGVGRQPDQPLSNIIDESVVVDIPCGIVPEHRFAHGASRCKRARCQQQVRDVVVHHIASKSQIQESESIKAGNSATDRITSSAPAPRRMSSAF